MIIFLCNVFMFLDLSQLHRQQDMKLDTAGWSIWDISVVTDTRLLVTVWRVRKVSLVDSQTGGTVAHITLEHEPVRVCMLDNNTAVVTLDGHKLQFINIDGDSLTLGQPISVSGDVWGIARSDEVLVVSYLSSPWLEVLSKNGIVLHSFDNQAVGSSVFKWPTFISISADNMIYVSDEDTSTITQLDSYLRITKTFSDPILQGPCGIISLSADQVLVCSCYNNRILLLSPSTGVITSILDQQDGIEGPWALTFSPSQRKLYVVPNELSGRVQVYQQQ